jgi:hypothetical protein
MDVKHTQIVAHHHVLIIHVGDQSLRYPFCRTFPENNALYRYRLLGHHNTADAGQEHNKGI